MKYNKWEPKQTRLTASDLGKKARLVFYSSVGATGLLYLIPFGQVIAYPFVLLSTLFHEMGHGLAALLVGGRFSSFEMWTDGSGVAHIEGSFGRLAQAFVSAGGLMGPAIMAALLFACGRSASFSRLCLMGLGVLLIIAEILVVRNGFGFIFVGLMALLLLFLGQQSRSSFTQIPTIFLAVQLSLSVFSRSDYLFTPLAQTPHGFMPSDVAVIAEALFLPYWFWGALCGLTSFFTLYMGMRFYWRKR